MDSEKDSQHVFSGDRLTVSNAMFITVYLLIIIGAAALRIYRIGRDEMWFDETISAVTAMGGVKDILSGTYSPKSPPLYYLLLCFWIRAFGITEIAMRSLSSALGIGLVAGVGYAGSRMFSRAAGLCAMGLAATAPLGVYYSMETRCYMLLAFLALWHALFLFESLEKNKLIYWIAYIATGAALAHTHVWGLFILPSGLLFIASKHRKNLIVSLIAIAALAAPFWIRTVLSSSLEMADWVSMMWDSLRPGEAFIKTIGGLGSGGDYSKLIFRLYQPPISFINYFALALFLIILAAGVFRAKGSISSAQALALRIATAAFAAPLAIGYAITALWQPVYLVGRTDFIAAPAFYLLAGAGVARFHPQIRAVLFSFILLLSIYNLSVFYTREPFDSRRAAAKYIINNMSNGDAAICSGNTCFPMVYYLKRYGADVRLAHFPSISLFAATGGKPDALMSESDAIIKLAQDISKDCDRNLPENGRVFLTVDQRGFESLNQILIDALAAKFRLKEIGNRENGVPALIFVRR